MMMVANAAHAGVDEWLLTAEPGWALLSGDEARHGAGGTVSFALGVSPATWLFAAGGAYVVPGDDPTTIVEVVGGLVVALDVLRTVPFLEAAGGLDLLDGTPAPLLRVGVGADYLVSPSFSVGGVVRYRPLFGVESERLLTLDLRLSWRSEL